MILVTLVFYSWTPVMIITDDYFYHALLIEMRIGRMLGGRSFVNVVQCWNSDCMSVFIMRPKAKINDSFGKTPIKGWVKAFFERGLCLLQLAGQGGRPHPADDKGTSVLLCPPRWQLDWVRSSNQRGVWWKHFCLISSLSMSTSDALWTKQRNSAAGDKVKHTKTVWGSFFLVRIWQHLIFSSHLRVDKEENEYKYVKHQYLFKCTGCRMYRAFFPQPIFRFDKEAKHSHSNQ